ncbi:hypothetical protein ACN6QN_07380, partial [Acinetobacter baumannii]
MQKPIKCGDAWRITVRYLGKRYTATRDTANECEQWAAKKLLELQSEQANPESEKIHISFYAPVSYTHLRAHETHYTISVCGVW